MLRLCKGQYRAFTSGSPPNTPSQAEPLTSLQGILIGPSLQTQLRTHFPTMKTYPVRYAASISTNVSPARTDRASIAKGNQAFQEAAGCSTIIAGGYSQGAGTLSPSLFSCHSANVHPAVMHNVISHLSPSIKSKIAGVALFGDTRNLQDRGHIPDFPIAKSRVWCNVSDGVCGGALLVDAGHLSYSNSQIREAATYLAGRVKSAGGDSSARGNGGLAGALKGLGGAKGGDLAGVLKGLGGAGKGVKSGKGVRRSYVESVL